MGSRRRSVRGRTLHTSFRSVWPFHIKTSFFQPGGSFQNPTTMLHFLEGSLVLQNSVALPRSLDLFGLANGITSTFASININTLLPLILAIKAAFVVGVLVKDKIGFLFPYPIHAVPLTQQVFSYSSLPHRYQRMADFAENSSLGDDFDIAFYDNING